MAKHQLKPNTIYCGDNLKMLKEIPDESVDMIYLDPPFNSNRSYEVLWGDNQEKRAFDDRFGDVKYYIDYMKPRIVELYRALKPTGNFYYHCDWHASHYVKIMLDQIFDFNNFRNEIIWCYTGPGSPAMKQFNRKHDNIFWYSKGDTWTFNKKDVLMPYKGGSPHAGGFTEKDGGRLNPDEYKSGKVPEDWWSDIAIVARSKNERLGYPTQKPIALMERIILSGSNKGDVILDPFCGCGTTIAASHKNGRKWIGIDISPTACRVMSQRLWDTFKLDEGKDFFVQDLKKSEEELRLLPPFEFQNWACIALGGIPNKRKSGDFGIDGKLYPIEIGKKKKSEKDLFGESDIYYPIQVKQKDKAGRPDIDSFETAIRRDGRTKGYFLAFDFSSDAIKEIKRLDKEGQIEIIPITVNQLINME